MAYRPLLQIAGLLFLLYAIIALSITPQGGFIALGLAIVILLITYSYHLTLYLAKIGSWLGTVLKKYN
jgi:hypothetical protein